MSVNPAPQRPREVALLYTWSEEQTRAQRPDDTPEAALLHEARVEPRQTAGAEGRPRTASGHPAPSTPSAGLNSLFPPSCFLPPSLGWRLNHISSLFKTLYPFPTDPQNHWEKSVNR